MGARPKAEALISDAYLRGDQKVSLVGMQVQDLTFLAQAATDDGEENSNQLTSLKLSTMWDTVLEIDVSSNMISQIDALNQFRNLKILRANYNYILEVSLT